MGETGARWGYSNEIKNSYLYFATDKNSLMYSKANKDLIKNSETTRNHFEAFSFEIHQIKIYFAVCIHLDFMV